MTITLAIPGVNAVTTTRDRATLTVAVAASIVMIMAGIPGTDPDKPVRKMIATTTTDAMEIITRTVITATRGTTTALARGKKHHMFRPTAVLGLHFFD